MMMATPPPRLAPSLADVRTDMQISHPEADVSLSATASVKTAHVTHPDGEYVVDYGTDPVNGSGTVSAVVSDNGGTWTLLRGPGMGPQGRGFSYLWGYWLLFETDRTRTITWGGIATVSGRMVPPGDGLPERDQVFVLCGEAEVSPNGVSEQGAVRVGKGFYVSATTVEGKVVFSQPMPIPTPGMGNPPPDAKDIIAFLDAMTATHPDPCNP